MVTKTARGIVHLLQSVTLHPCTVIITESKEHYNEIYINGIIGEGGDIPLLISASNDFFIYGCLGCIPSNHHATVLEGSGGEGERDHHRTSSCRPIVYMYILLQFPPLPVISLL